MLREEASKNINIIDADNREELMALDNFKDKCIQLLKSEQNAIKTHLENAKQKWEIDKDQESKNYYKNI